MRGNIINNGNAQLLVLKTAFDTFQNEPFPKVIINVQTSQLSVLIQEA